IGADIFVKAIDNNDGHVVFHLPSSGRWIDYWTGERHQGGSLIEGTWPLQQFPLYVRAGAIIPQRDAAKPGKTVFNIYPSKQMEERIFHLPTADGIDYYNCRVSYDPQQQRVTLDADRSVEAVFVVGQKQVAAKGSRISKRIKQ
ncbi:MAG: hypothetical protein IKG77_04095, partial [Prevotella sp.]|nr:hypothetical protein [Prevotella sp.]